MIEFLQILRLLTHIDLHWIQVDIDIEAWQSGRQQSKYHCWDKNHYKYFLGNVPL